ncbi:hypothetical protein CK203_011366 [Vitis vinifera]|uniref:Uncharacterized protein n=1 Tax=Vitis vinifera TaxID=29760 RepID=A0A438JYX7_VITVI|nr:hypothetical protein CK203_011366 [Vitis vinifera]
MSSKQKATSSARASDVREKATDKLDVKEFRDRFCIPNGVIVELLNDEEVPALTEKFEKNTIIFSKEQFNAGLRFPLPALFKEFLHFTQIPPAFIHPNIVRVLMGCSIISMLYNLDLTLLETKGGAKGHVAVRGAWAGSSGRPGRPFSPNYSLVIPGPEKRGHLVDWVEKASFACLSKLFEIDAKERHYKTLLTARNLMAVVRESPREFKEADVEKRRALLDNREKKKNEGTLRKAPGQKRGAASPANKAPAKRRKLVKMGRDRLRDPDGGSGGRKPESALGRSGPFGSCSGEGATFEEISFGAQPEVRAHRAASRSQQEIEVSCSSAYNAHPDGGEVEVTTKTLAVLVVPDEDAPDEPHPAENVEAPNPEQESPSVASSSGNHVNDVACISASSFSYAELEDKLKQIPPGLTTVVPSANMFEMVESLVSDWGRLRPAYPPLGGENEALRADLADAKSREESMEARLREAEDEMARLRGEVRQLRTEASIEKKQKEDLQLRLTAQKEELQREFAAEREELEADYQKQVDDTFIFGYRCCMKKNGIKRDVPSIPPGEEKKL